MNSKALLTVIGVALIGVAIYLAHGLVIALLAVAGAVCIVASREVL